MTHFLRRFESVHQDFTWYTYIKVAYDTVWNIRWFDPVAIEKHSPNHEHNWTIIMKTPPTNPNKYDFHMVFTGWTVTFFLSWKLWPATLPPVMSSPTGCDPPNGKTSRVQAVQAPPPQGCFAAWLEILATKMVMVGDEIGWKWWEMSSPRNLSYWGSGSRSLYKIRNSSIIPVAPL